MRKKVICIFTAVISVVIISITGIAYLGLKDKNKSIDYTDLKKVSGFTGRTAEVLLGEEKNACYSPVSLYVSLCGVAELTSEEASSKVLSVLGYTNLSEMEKSYNGIVKKVSKVEENDGVVLAGSIWISMDEEDKTENKEYLDGIAKRLGKDIFAKNIKQLDVDLWAANKTNGKIKEVGQIKDGITKVLLADVISFEAMWSEKFTENRKGPFWISEDESTDVMFMIGEKEEMDALINKEYTAVRKTYTDGSGMIFIEAESGEIEDVISAENIASIIEAFYSGKTEKREVELTVPRFEIEGGIQQNIMEKLFKSLGLEVVLEERAWDRFMVSEESVPLYLEQKANIAVYEEGTKAQAVEYITWVDYSKNDVIIEIILNKPFMYILEKNGVPLFIGTVYNPAE